MSGDERPARESDPACAHRQCEEKYLGEDVQQGRYADVHLRTCPACGACWIHYAFAFEAFSGSGRWYEGRISAEQARRVTAATAAALIESLASYRAGGSFFDGEVRTRSGPLL